MKIEEKESYKHEGLMMIIIPVVYAIIYSILGTDFSRPYEINWLLFFYGMIPFGYGMYLTAETEENKKTIGDEK